MKSPDAFPVNDVFFQLNSLISLDINIFFPKTFNFLRKAFGNFYLIYKQESEGEINLIIKMIFWHC